MQFLAKMTYLAQKGHILTFLAQKCWFIELNLKLSSDVVQSKENPSKFYDGLFL